MLDRLEDVTRERGLHFEAVDIDRLGAEADVIITITSSFDPILNALQVRPGTHLACMGTDTKGKQEVEAELVAVATVFTDEVAQAVTIGEAQHAVARGLIAESDIIEIGAVINGKHPGRTSMQEITLFDGTGVGLQDLAVASAAVDLAIAKGIAVEIEF
jgi:ornithine cyclodeaminase